MHVDTRDKKNQIATHSNTPSLKVYVHEQLPIALGLDTCTQHNTQTYKTNTSQLIKVISRYRVCSGVTTLLW